MKKSLVVLLSLLLLLSSCSHEPNIDWSENNDRVFLENTCTDYFFNLTENYPTNSKGSCGYVAACALFAYYDLYYDETIVEEKYELRDTKSFGLKHINLSDVESLNNKEYYQYLTDHQDEYLMAKLIVSSNENLLSKKTGKPILYNFNSSSPTLVYIADLHVIMNYYLKDLRNIDPEYISAEKISNNNDKMRNDIICKVKEGVSVLASVKKRRKGIGNWEGHICIIYDYDAVEDELYAHLLMQPEYNESRMYNHVKLSSCYERIEYPICLEIKE